MEFMACLFFLVAVWLVIWPVLFLLRLMSLEETVRKWGIAQQGVQQTTPATEATSISGTTRPETVPIQSAGILPKQSKDIVPAQLIGPEPNEIPKADTARIDEVQQSPKPARQPSAFETAAFDALRKMRNWLIIGKESLPEGSSWEFALASQWLLRIGVLILLMGIGFFAKISIENEWIGPIGQVLLIAMVGMALLATGGNILGGTYHLIGQGLLGAGLVTLYFAVYAAHGMFHVIDMVSAFALMMVVTTLATSLAVRFNSLLVAVIGVLGGYATPVFMESTTVNYPGLLGYMLVLGFGVLGVSWWRKWHLLQLLALGSDILLFQLSMRHYGQSDFPVVMPFAASRFLLFSTMAFLHNIIRREKSNLLDLLALAMNAWAFFLNGQWMIGQIWGTEAASGLALALAFFYAAHVMVFLRLRVVDRELLTGFLGLASLFLSVAIPMLFSDRWLTSSWALQALAMAWVAQQLGSKVLGQFTMLLMVLVLGRYAMVDLPRHATETISMEMPLLEFLIQSFGRMMEFSLPAAAVFASSWLIASFPESSAKIEKDNDYPEFFPSGSFSTWMVTLILLVLFPFLYMEASRQLLYLAEPVWPSGLTLLAVAVAIGIFYRIRQTCHIMMVLACMVLIAILLVTKLLVIDLYGYWGYGQYPTNLFSRSYSSIHSLSRLVDFGLVVAWLIWLAWTFSKSQITRQAGIVLTIVAICLSLLHARLETINVLHYLDMDGLAEGAISIVWCLYALASLLIGFIRNYKPARICGLVLFTMIAFKVFIIDLAALDQIYKVVAFVILGSLLLAGAFLYLKFQSSDQNPDTKEKEIS